MFQLIGNANNMARALNISGQVVGSFKDANGNDRAYIFQNNQMTDLNTLIPSTSGWVVRVAQAINDTGQIVGYGTIGGETHAFMMTPIPSTYNVTEIPLIYDTNNLDANWIRINNRGQVVGQSPQGRAAVWDMGNNLLTELTNGWSHATDINDWGEIVGSNGRAFYYANGLMTDLGTLGGAGSIARGINYAGQIVGTSPAAVKDRAFITTPNSVSMTALPLPPGLYTHSGAGAINNSGQVVGQAFYNSQGMSVSSAFFWTATSGSIILPSAGNSAQALDINNAGQAVGSSQFGGQQYEHACIWTKDNSGQWRITDLEPSFASPSSVAWAINNLGQIVGYSSNSGGAFLWHNGTMIDLNSKLPPGAGIILLNALDINDNGQIVCVGRVLGQQQRRIYLLTQ
jgi:probable HAF family extracellular repeat protein